MKLSKSHEDVWKQGRGFILMPADRFGLISCCPVMSMCSSMCLMSARLHQLQHCHWDGLRVQNCILLRARHSVLRN